MKRPLLALALLLFVVLGCEPTNTTNASSDSGADSGPVATSGPDRPDYGPTRHPAENAHDYSLRQQGQIGPCGLAWDEFHASYFNWKNGMIPEGQHRDAERQYDGCVAQNYR